MYRRDSGHRFAVGRLVVADTRRAAVEMRSVVADRHRVVAAETRLALADTHQVQVDRRRVEAHYSRDPLRSPS